MRSAPATQAFLCALWALCSLAAAGDAAARGHPFRGEYAPVANMNALVAGARRGDTGPLLETLRRDPHLAALDRKLDFGEQLTRARQGTFNGFRFLRQGVRAVKEYVRDNKRELSTAFRREESRELEHLLSRKLWSLAGMISGGTCAGGRCAPGTSEAVETLFGSRKTHAVAMERVSNVRPVLGGQRAVDRYGWQLASGSAGGKPRATARVEVGRAVFHHDVDLDPRTGAMTTGGAAPAPGRIRTQPINKGVGPTRWAGNAFSQRTSGVFTLMQGEHDVKISRRLAAGGVPVYKPDGLLALPYWDWHPRMGWRPMATYARVPQENLRVSDLRLLSRAKRKQVLGSLRRKIAAVSALPEGQVSDIDVVRFFVGRMGRIAGLFEGGRTFGGKRFFHGMMHAANVSLMAEMVDFSESPGFLDSKRGLREAYKKSIYRKPNHDWPAELQSASSEKIVFKFVINHFMNGIYPLLRPDQRPPAGLVQSIFNRAYREGLAGRRADGRDLLEAARRPF